MNAFNFNSRETYLAWRANWKKEYKETSSLIRSTKNNIKNQHRTQGYANSIEWSTYNRAYNDACNALEILKLSKIEANRQYLETVKEKELVA